MDNQMPARVEIKQRKLCLYCGTPMEPNEDSTRHKGFPTVLCVPCEGVESAGAHRSPAAAIQTLKALEPAQQVEVIKELVQGLDVAVVPREPTNEMIMAGSHAAKKYWADEEDSMYAICVYEAMLQADSQGER